jgi:hypothetical protein
LDLLEIPVGGKGRGAVLVGTVVVVARVVGIPVVKVPVIIGVVPMEAEETHNPPHPSTLLY